MTSEEYEETYQSLFHLGKAISLFNIQISKKYF
jgi:hypothetical protein